MKMIKTHKFSVGQVVWLEIDSKGKVSQRLSSLDKRDSLENTLLNYLYPGIKVAIVTVPEDGLDDYEESLVRNAMTNLTFKGIRYKLAGGSGGTKKGIFYFVDTAYSKVLAERFQNWPQAAVIYFGILVSGCKVVTGFDDARVLVVKDGVLGTNDCRGWIRRSLFQELQSVHQKQIAAKEFHRLVRERKQKLSSGRRKETPNASEQIRLAAVAMAYGEKQMMPEGCFYQFRLAFDKTQAKGSFKIADDDVCDRLEADIIMPESSVKPELKIPIEFFSIFGEGRRFRGPVVLGIREVSRDLEFESSYTLIEHAPDDSLQLEILPEAMKQVQRLNRALSEGNYEQLLEILGLENSEMSEDEEARNVEAALIADQTGYIIRHPYINNQLNKLLAHWAYKSATGGGFRLPAFALADDGYLVLHEDCVYSGSDWIPEDQAITSLDSKRGLCVRYPIRMFEDLLPFENIGASELIMRLTGQLDGKGCGASVELAQRIATTQLWLRGTYILHSVTAKKNGGDYDFDWICVLEGYRFPRFVKSRFDLVNPYVQEKIKLVKRKSPWFNMEAVAMKARGNLIGMITDLKTSCLAAGRPDLAYRLVTELQNALDSLKHNVEPNLDVIAEIRKEVKQALWLKYKNEQSIAGLPLHLEVAPTDKVGKLYNFVRKDIEELLSSKMAIKEFMGLVTGETVTEEMFHESRRVYRSYSVVVIGMMNRQKQLKVELAKATAEWEEARKDSDKVLRNKKYLVKKKAQAALRAGEEQAKGEMKAIISWVRVWAAGKEDNRMGWCQALHEVVCKGDGTGSLLFYAFPQEYINKLAETMGGRAVRVALPQLEGISSTIDPEGRAFLVEKLEDGGEKLNFLFQNKDGKILLQQ